MSTQPSNIPILPSPQDYTAADFDACAEALQNDVNQAFPEWTDFNRASPGNVLLLAFCYVLDILTKYQNDQARECFIATVRRRRNMLAHARGLGIRLKGISAASADLTFTLPVALGQDVIIPAGTKITTAGLEEVIEFFTVAELRIVATTLTGVVSAENAEPREETVVSDGTASQEFRTSFTGYIEGSTTFEHQGVEWVQVPDFFFSGPTSKHFTVRVDEEDRLFVVTGNGVNGQIPAQGNITLGYKTGGGSRGNVQANAITVLGTALFDIGGNAANATVTNLAAATGGADRESVEQARRRIPGQLRAKSRTVSREDFEINGLAVPGVARTMMLTTDEDPTVPDNTGDLLILAASDPPSVPASAALKAAVLAQVTVVFPTMVTFVVNVVDPTLKTINIVADVKVKAGFTTAQVTANINAALQAFFALQDANGAPNIEVDFGANLVDNLVPFSDLFNAVRDAAGVERVDKSTFLPAAETTLTLREFPKLGTVTVGFL